MCATCLSRLDKFVGTLDEQRGSLVASIHGLNRLAGALAGQRDVITEALRKIPPALDVLISERPRIITALDKLRVFSDTATRLVNDAGADLVKNLKNLEPTIRALADVGPDLDAVLAYAPTYPFTQNFIDRDIRGDYVNGFFTLDLTNARLRKSVLLGTHWGRLGAELVPAPGDPGYLQYQYTPDPLHPSAPGPVAPPVGAPLTPTAAPAPVPAVPLPLPPPGAPPPVPPPPRPLLGPPDPAEQGTRANADAAVRDPTGGRDQLMLTRFVRIQLAIFTITGIIGLAVMAFSYIQVPTLLGIGRMTVTLELPDAGGLYRFSNVTYRGVQVGKVTAVTLTSTGAKATLSLGYVAEDPGGPASGGAQHLGGRRTVRGFTAANQLAALPARRLSHRRGRRHDPAAGRPAARSDQSVAQQHPQGQAQRDCSTSPSRHSTGPVTISVRCSTRQRSSPVISTASPTAPEP